MYPSQWSDCTGPARAGIKWLQGVGLGMKPKPVSDMTISYDPQMRYATFKYKLPSDISEKLPEYNELSKTAGLFAYKGDAKHSQVIVACQLLENDFGKLR
jgi:hypothetical protein